MSNDSITVLAPALYVRPKPNFVDAPVGTLNKGATVEVIADLPGWFNVRAGPSASAYVSSNPRYVRFRPATATPAGFPSIRLKATVNVRSGPDANAEDIGDAEADSEFEVDGQVRGWYRIRWNDSFAYITASPKYSDKIAPGAAPIVTAPSAPAAGGRLAWTPSTVAALVAPDANMNLPLTPDMLDSNALRQPAYATRADMLAALTGGRVRTPEQFKAADECIAAQPEADRADLYELLTLFTPYFSQRDNNARVGTAMLENEGGRMCNLTSLAMLLSRQGVRPIGKELQPEDRLEAIRVEKNFGPRTTYLGWGKVAESQGMKTHWLKGSPDVCPIDWWKREPLNYIQRGYGIMASITGHIVAVVGICADRIYVHDPYGSNKLLPDDKKAWTGSNAYAPGGGISQSIVGRWLSHGTNELKDHRWNWVIAMRATALGGT